MRRKHLMDVLRGLLRVGLVSAIVSTSTPPSMALGPALRPASTSVSADFTQQALTLWLTQLLRKPARYGTYGLAQSLGPDVQKFLRKARQAGWIKPNVSDQDGLVLLYRGANDEYLLTAEEREPYLSTLAAIQKSFDEEPKESLPSGVKIHVSYSPGLLAIDDWSLCTTVKAKNELHVYVHVNLLHAIQSLDRDRGVPHARLVVENFAEALAPELKHSNALSIPSLAQALAHHEIAGLLWAKSQPSGATDAQFHATQAGWNSEQKQAQLALAVVAMAAVSESASFLDDPRSEDIYERFKNTQRPILRKVLAQRTDLTEEEKREMEELLLTPENIFYFPIVYHNDADFDVVRLGNRVANKNGFKAAKGGLRYAGKNFRKEKGKEEHGETPRTSAMLTGRMTDKNSDIDFGGGKGGIDVRPFQPTAHERKELGAGYIRGGISAAGPHFIGPKTDIPAPDQNTGGRDMIAMDEAYIRFLYQHRRLPEEIQRELEKRHEQLERDYAAITLLDGERLFYMDTHSDRVYRPDQLERLNPVIRRRLLTYRVPASEKGKPTKARLLAAYQPWSSPEIQAAPMMQTILAIKKEYDQTHATPLPLPMFAAITGKSPDLGGSLGREEATGRGAAYIVQFLMEYLQSHPELLAQNPRLHDVVHKEKKDIRVSVQGLGNAGLAVALLLHQWGYRVIRVSNASPGQKGTLENEDGINMEALMQHMAESKSYEEFDGATFYENDLARVLMMETDILIPAATQDRIVSQGADYSIGQVNAADIKAPILIEVANGPVADPREDEARTADSILAAMGIVVVPGELANSGGVKGSIAEFEQNMKGERWTLEQVRVYIQQALKRSFDELMENAQGDLTHLRQIRTFWSLNKVVTAVIARKKNPQPSLYEPLPELDGVFEHVTSFMTQDFSFASLTRSLPILSDRADRALLRLFNYGILKRLTRQTPDGLVEKVYVVSNTVKWIQSLREPGSPLGAFRMLQHAA